MNPADAHVVLAYKNFAALKNISHIGLGVSAHLTAKYLNKKSIRTQVLSLVQPSDLRTSIERYVNSKIPVTHVVVSAPWIPTREYQYLCNEYPFIHWAMNCHSNVGFLQADANGARLFRDALDLEAGTSNFRAAGNSQRFVQWVETAYRSPCAYLPNLYFLRPVGESGRPGWHHTGGVLRIGIFGAARAQKNIMTMVGAAIEISSVLKAQTEIWLSTEREDDQASRMIMNAARALTDNLPNVKLVASPWAPWSQFRKIVANMHLLLQVSYTESFNLVAADGCAEGVPSVVSSAIDWAPSQWVAEVDDTQDVASVGLSLLANPVAGCMGTRALKRHNATGLAAWEQYLTGTRP